MHTPIHVRETPGGFINPASAKKNRGITMVSSFCLLSFLSWGKQTWMMSILKALWPFPESLLCKVRWRRVPLGVRKSRLAMVPVLCHPTVGSEETIVNLVSVDMFVLPLPRLPFFCPLASHASTPISQKCPPYFLPPSPWILFRRTVAFYPLTPCPLLWWQHVSFIQVLTGFCFILCKLPSWFQRLVYFHRATVCIALLVRISVIFKE